MDDSWWIKPDELDKRQRQVIALPLEGSHVLLGPPGSGKTNLLLLRARHLTLARRHNFGIVCFTRSLEAFLRRGARQYQVDDSKVATWTRFSLSLARQAGKQVSPNGTFEEQRRTILAVLTELLIDEGQDYWPEEIAILRSVAENTLFTADSRQKIYDGEEVVSQLRAHGATVIDLKYHYRAGARICQVADGLGSGMPSYDPILPTSNYSEAKLPSRVEVISSKDLTGQIGRVVADLRDQLKAYPDGLLGVLAPGREVAQSALADLQAGPLGRYCRDIEDVGDERDDDGRVLVGTIHKAKGMEFRAVHLVGAEGLKKFATQRYLAYVAVTRAKTSLSVHHSQPLPGYLEQALVDPGDAPLSPDLDSLFKRTP
jgi:superfamily I DNA/RNA helicase